MIREAHGNLLDADVDALVNTVNTVGVMGKGIALQFKNAYPANFKTYRAAAGRGEVHLGTMFVFDAGQLVRPRWVINFPTKQHWRSGSRLQDVASGLNDLRRVLVELGVRSVAIPPLGCGNGGLEWHDVRPVIEDKLADLGVEILLYPPDGPPRPAEMRTRTARPVLTAGKAALVGMLARYSGPAVGATLIETQKLMYFLQEAGQPLQLRFTKARYGPYADRLRHVLKSVENHYLQGFGDGAKRVWEADPIEVLPGAAEEAAEVLANEPDTEERMNRVLRLIVGFESAYGLELLATAHWAARHECDSEAHTRPRIVDTVTKWSRRKQVMFPEHHIEAALTRLEEEEWIAIPSPA